MAEQGEAHRPRQKASFRPPQTTDPADGLHHQARKRENSKMNAEQDPDRPRDRPGARWLIDGMNLIGSRPDRWWNDPDRAVRRLIGELDRYAAVTGEPVTVVFDRQPPGVPPGAHGAIAVAFASWRGRDAADHEIVRMLAEDEDPETVRVVTSDRRLAERARELGAAVMSSTPFRRRMEQALAGAPTEGA
jgi:predicted RNA-binding protein with PIN domain